MSRDVIVFAHGRINLDSQHDHQSILTVAGIAFFLIYFVVAVVLIVLLMFWEVFRGERIKQNNVLVIFYFFRAYFV